MADVVERTVRVLHRLHDELVDLAGQLSEAEARAQSYCDEWSVAQVYSHLGSGAEIGREELSAASAGEDPPARESIWARWDALEPAEMVRRFAPSDARYLEVIDDLLEAGGPAPEEIRVPLHGWSLDLQTFLVFRLLEIGLHQWDVQVVREPTVEVDTEAAQLLLQAYPLQFVGQAADSSVAQRIGPAVVRTEIADVARTVDIVVGTPVMVMRDGQLPETVKSGSVTTVAIPTAGTWCRSLSGRLDPAHTPAALSIRGPVDLNDLRHLFPGG
jgi:hypothetical protein